MRFTLKSNIDETTATAAAQKEVEFRIGVAGMATTVKLGVRV